MFDSICCERGEADVYSYDSPVCMHVYRIHHVWMFFFPLGNKIVHAFQANVVTNTVSTLDAALWKTHIQNTTQIKAMYVCFLLQYNLKHCLV